MARSTQGRDERNSSGRQQSENCRTNEKDKFKVEVVLKTSENFSDSSDDSKSSSKDNNASFFRFGLFYPLIF